MMAHRAMCFARQVHRDHKRKYTGAPYTDHLAEVAGIVGSLYASTLGCNYVMTVAWLHDTIEDCGVTRGQLEEEFTSEVANGVLMLSDLETTGNRAERKAASRIRLAAAKPWIQDIKCADLISNTQSIVEYDPKFAVTYLEEKRLLLDVLTKADRRLWNMARELAEAA